MPKTMHDEFIRIKASGVLNAHGVGKNVILDQYLALASIRQSLLAVGCHQHFSDRV